MWICSLFKETQAHRNTTLIYNPGTHIHKHTNSLEFKMGKT